MKMIRVTGRVQGVAFRYFTKKKADELNIKGTVQNMSDGSVLIYASSDRIDEFVDWCYKGPTAARVDAVIISLVEGLKEHHDFKIVR